MPGGGSTYAYTVNLCLQPTYAPPISAATSAIELRKSSPLELSCPNLILPARMWCLSPFQSKDGCDWFGKVAVVADFVNGKLQKVCFVSET